MKQTNNAIKFLMAQYRAIFKHAYLKGLVSAVALTAGLASSNVQAATTWYAGDPDSGWAENSAPYTDSSGPVNAISTGKLNLSDYTDLTSETTSVSGGRFSLSLDGEIRNVGINQDAYGGYGKLSIGTATLHITDNQLKLEDNLLANGSLYGAYALNKSGSVSASLNKVIISNRDFKDLSQVHSATSGIGGIKVVSETGALLEQNEATISGSTGTEIDLKSKGFVTGAWAETSGATSTGNFIVRNNKVDITNSITTMDSSNVLEITGGKASASASSVGDFSLVSEGNTINLNTFTLTGGTAYSTIIGNYADSSQTTTTNPKVEATANGSKDSITPSLKITDGTLSKVNIAGGIATTNGGSAFANYNTLEIIDSTLSSGEAIGGKVNVLSGTQSVITSDYNKVTITNTKTDVVDQKNLSDISIIGSSIDFAFESGGNGSGSKIQSNNNQVTLGENINLTDGNIIGAKISSADDNATITSKGNQVIVNGLVSDTNTSDGTTLDIMAVSLENSAAATSTGNIITTDNNVTIGKTASIENVDIYAVYSNNMNTIATNNDVTIEGKVKNASIYGGQGNDSIISLGAGSEYTADVAGVKIVSDKIDLAGKITIESASDLTIQGYFSDGNSSNTTNNTNSNLTTVKNTAEIYNGNELKILGHVDVESNAVLSAKKAGAKLTVDASSSKATRSNEDIQEEYGVLSIYKSQVDSYLTEDTVGGNLSEDAKGTISIVNNGVLHFKDDAVTVSDYAFSNAKDAGKLHVNNTSTIRAKTINIAHQLLADNQSTKAGLSMDEMLDVSNKFDGASNGVKFEANILNLGSSSLSSTESANILFSKGTAKDEINFAVKSGDFLLTSAVAGNNYMRTQDLSEKLDYYTALNGVITGDVNVQTGGSLNIEYGHWTAKDNITLSGSGSLNIGNDVDNLSGTHANHNSIADATLTLDKALTISVATKTTDASTITVTGNDDSERYDFEDAADTIGDDGLALLDLSNGLELLASSNGDINGKATITATSGGIIKLNASDLNDILIANNGATSSTSGAFFEADDFGVLQVAGDVVTNFSDFGGGVIATPENGITLKKDGYLVADSLSVLNQHKDPIADEKGYTFQSLDLGHESGAVVVKDLVISDLQQTNGQSKPSGANSYASKVTFARGTAIISESLTSNNHTLILGDANSGTNAHIYLESALATDEGKIDVANIQIDSGSFNVDNGSWDASKTTFKLTGADSKLVVDGGDGSDVNDTPYTPSLVASGVVMGAGSLLNIAANGTATFDTADFNKLTVATYDAIVPESGVHVAGTLVINGSADAKLADNTTDDHANGVKFGAEGSIVIDNNGILKFGSLATTGAIIADGQYSGSGSIDMADGYSKINNQGGELHLGFANTTKFDGDAIKALKKELFTDGSLDGGVLINGGVLNIGDATFDGIDVDPLTGPGLSGYTAKWEDLKDFSDIYGTDVTNDTLIQTNVSDVNVGDKVQGHWGSISLVSNAASSAQAVLAGNVTLRYAEGNNGFFISNVDHTEARGAIVESQKDLTLSGGGKIAKVTLENGKNDAEKNLTVLKVIGGDTYIEAIEGSKAGAVIAENTLVEALSNTTVSGDIKNIGELAALNGSTVKATNATVGEFYTELSHIAIDKKLEFDVGNILGGSVSATDAVMNGDKLEIAHEGIFTAETFKVVNGGRINVGFDSANESYTFDDGTKINGTGYFDVGVLELNGSTLITDPAYGEKTSVSAVGLFKDGTNKSYANQSINDAGILNGKIWVGKNAVQGIGANKAETLEAIATYQNNGSLQEDKYGSILYLNGQLTVANGSEIALNAHESEDLIRESLKYTITSQVLDQYADLGLGTNTAILMTENAFEDKDGNKTGTAIYFNRKAALVNGAGGEILLSGTFDASDKLNIFDDEDGNGVDVKGSIDVLTQNGFLYATLEGDNQGKGVQLEVNKDKAYSIMSDASNPVIETLISYHADRIVKETEQDPAPETGEEEETVPATDIVASNTKGGANVSVGDTGTTEPSEPAPEEPSTEPETPSTPVVATKVTGNSLFLNEVVNTSHGAPAEAAARLAVYGGAAQAALAANSSNAEMISSRMGIGGQNPALTSANNGQGAGLWVSPIYKSQDSDGFGAQGLNYGVDMSLYGLALGGDFTLDNGMTFGAMFNVGSGDADGQGNTAAANTTNDFDYWGLAVYGGYSFDKFNVVADLGYTVVDNTLEANTGMQETTKLTASTDSTALTFGVTGQYEFDFNGYIVAPHAGIRYTNIDLDDYTVKGNEDVAHYSSDSMSIFSIPVGVALSTDIVAGNWVVKPSLDLTLTANMGDDSIEGTTTWTGVSNLATRTESEVMDNFTYGANFGVSAQTGNFSLGFGVNYTGSSNTDEYGVKANAIFTF